MSKKGTSPLRNDLVRKSFCQVQFQGLEDGPVEEPSIAFAANLLGGTNYTFTWREFRETDTYIFYFDGTQQGDILDENAYTIQDPLGGTHSLKVEYYDEHDNNYLTIENTDGFKVYSGSHSLNADEAANTVVINNLGSKEWNWIQFYGTYSFEEITNTAFAGVIKFSFWLEPDEVIQDQFEENPNEVSDESYGGQLGGRVSQSDYPSKSAFDVASLINQHINSGHCTNTWKVAILETS